MSLSDVEHDDAAEQLLPLVLAFEEALAAGEPTPVIDASSLPFELQPELQQIQACLKLLDDASRAQAILESPVGNTEDASSGQIGRFEIVRELGRGGYGVVLLARDPTIDRYVALKIPRPEVLVTADLRQRFLREAQAAGSLEHPNLVSVYEVGEAGPICYIASAYCRGPSLSQWFKQSGSVIDLRLAVEIVAQLADGVDHAHHRGVLHRDIKSSNILLDLPENERIADQDKFAYTPRLTDFGLAKSGQTSDDFTRTGVVLGTPAYMAPEQAEGRTKDIGTTTDVYALGVVLYELLTGQLPFRGENDADTLRRIAIGELVRPRRLRHAIPLDLEAVVLRCLERCPQDRYRSAAALADDLRRFLAGEPTAARPLSPVERTWKWACRRPATAAVVVLSLLLASAISWGGWWHSVQLSRALDQTRQREKDVRHFLYATDMDRVKRALDSDNRRQAYDLLTRNIPQGDQPDLREFCWRHLWASIHEHRATLSGHDGDVYFVVYSPDGRTLATAGKDRLIRVWDASNGDCHRVLAGHTNEVNSVQFSNDGSVLVSASDDGTVRLWDATSGAKLQLIHAHDNGVFQAAFALGGKVLCTCGKESTVRVWDAVTLEPYGTLGGHTADVECLAVRPDGKMLATGSGNGQIKLWNLETLTEHCAFQAGARAISTLTFSRNGERLVHTGRETRESCEWSVKKKKKLRKLSQHYAWVHAAALLDGDSQLAVATKDGELKLYDYDSASLVRSINGHDGRIWCLAAAPDGQELATASADGTVKLWSLSRNRSHLSWSYPARLFQAHLDDDRLFVGGDSGRLLSWRVSDQTKLLEIQRDFEIVGDFDGDGLQDGGYFQGGCWRLRLARPSAGAELRTVDFGAVGDIPIVTDWNSDGRDDLGVFKGDRWAFDLDALGGDAEATVEFGNGQFPAESRFRQQIPLVGHWDSPTKAAVGLAAFDDNTWHVQLQRDNHRKLYHLTGDKEAHPLAGKLDSSGIDTVGLVDRDKLWIDVAQSGQWPEYLVEPIQGGSARRMHDCNLTISQHIAADERPILSPEMIEAAKDRADAARGYGQIQSLDVSSRDPLLATCAGDDRRIKLWNVDTGERVAVLRNRVGNVRQVAFSPDGMVLASCDDEGMVRIWDASTYSVLYEFKSHHGGYARMVFSPDGQWLVTSGDEGLIRCWKTERYDEMFSIEQESPHEIRTLCISADSKLLAAGTSGRTVNLFRIETGKQVARLTGHTESLCSVVFAPDGRTLASGSEDGTVRLWDLATYQEMCVFRNVGEVRTLQFGGDGESLVAVATRAGKSTFHRWSAPKTGSLP